MLLSLAWVLQGADFFMYRYFAPKYANTQREVFENTYSYERGTIQELRRYKMQYITATDSQKDAIASTMLQQLGEFPEKKLPPDLQDFVRTLRSRRGY